MSAGEVVAELVAVTDRLRGTHVALIGATGDSADAIQKWTHATTGSNNALIAEAARMAVAANTDITKAIDLVMAAEEKVLEYASIVDPGFTPPDTSIQEPDGKQLLEDSSRTSRIDRALRRSVRNVEGIKDKTEKFGATADKVKSVLAKKTGPPTATNTASASSAPQSGPTISYADAASNAIVGVILIGHATSLGIKRITNRFKQRKSHGSEN